MKNKENKETKQIIITDVGGKLQVNVTNGLTWPEACLMLFSTISNLADTTVDLILKTLPKSAKKTKKEIQGDIADMINYAASNVLNRLSPKDSDLSLSEVAIATLENDIIQEAAQTKRPIAEVLKDYESRIKHSPYYAGTQAKVHKGGKI